MNVMMPDWAYLIKFSSGTVKVGYTKRIDSRIEEHAKRAAVYGEVVDTWCAIVPDGYLAERALLAEARRMGTLLKRKAEWFSGLDFDHMRRFATDLFGDRESQEAVADIECAAAFDRMMRDIPDRA